MNYHLYNTILFTAFFFISIVPFEPQVKPYYTDCETEAQ